MPIRRANTEPAGQQKLLLTVILKDDSEAEIAERMLESFLPHMQGLAVAITGLSKKHDRLKKMVERASTHFNIPARYVVTTPATHPEIYHQKDSKDYVFADFSAARNAVFALAEEMQAEHQFDWWSWADCDDVLIGGEQLQQVAAQAQQHRLDAVYFNYWYAVQLDDQGDIKDVIIEHIRERLIRPGVFTWISRLHEVSVPKVEGYTPKNSEYPVDPKHGQTCVWVHLPPEKRTENNLKRNLEILEIQKAEERAAGKDDPRTTFYLGKTYKDYAHTYNQPEYLAKAEELFLIYLGEKPGGNTSGWEEERGNAWEYLGNMASDRGQHEKATEYYLRGVSEFPQSHMLYLLLAKNYFERGLRGKGKHWLEVASKMAPPSARTTVGTPHEIKVMLASLRYNDAVTEQRLDDAIHWLKIRNSLLDISEDPMLVTLEDAKELNEAALWLFNYAKWLKKNGHVEKVRKLLEAVAPEMQNEHFVAHIANEVLPPKTWPSKSIVYFAGPSFEAWSPTSMHKGLGGSETAIVQLARRWAALGYKVTVYGDPGAEAGEHEGVDYRPWQTINWNDQFYIFIVWRNPSLIDRGVKAYKLFYDAHDIENALNWPAERINRIDKVFFKSNWHRTHVPKLPDDKAAIIHNGTEVA